MHQVSYSPANPPSTVADGESASPMRTESEPPDSVGFSKSDIPKYCLDNSTICHETWSAFPISKLGTSKAYAWGTVDKAVR